MSNDTTTTRAHVSPVDFAIAWNSAPSAEACAKTLGMTVLSCENRARSERKRGVQVKQYPRKPGGRKRQSVDEINKAIVAAQKIAEKPAGKVAKK